ncbi:MAG: GGDEF domain-containing protein [Proteobacteria bacterium]|nr:GGDEF domain-containing protein [Pseudomonadota bacterium]
MVNSHNQENVIKTGRIQFFLVIVLIQFLLVAVSYSLFDIFPNINYYNLVLEFIISLGAIFLLFSAQPYKQFDFYNTLSKGYFLLFISYFIDSIDQVFIHSILYTVIMEKTTLIIAVFFIYIGSKKWMRNFKTISLTDDLTEIPNRRLCREIINKEIMFCQNQNLPLCLAIIDIDYFKSINDMHGHYAGDKILKSFAQLISGLIRKGDTVGRWGGEEFIILLKGADQLSAFKSMNRLKNKIADHSFDTGNKHLNLTASIGVCQMNKGDNFESLFTRADRALFAAKGAGRNTVKS